MVSTNLDTMLVLVTGTPIDMSSFYLFPLELKRHSERTLHVGVSFLAEENT